MINFYNQELQTRAKEYIEKIKNDSKKLDKENQKFIEDIFLTKKNETYYSYGGYLGRALTQELETKKDVKFNDIFSKSIYPALKLLMGEKFFKIFIEISKNITNYPFSSGCNRRMVRSKSYFNYINPLFNLLGNFVNLYFLNIDIITIIKREYEKGVYGIDNPYYIAYEIDNGNQKVIDLIKGALGSQKSEIDLTYNNMKAIFISNNKELIELTGKLLLAAKLQEGVRQQICENMDGGLQENFEYMFKIIYDNNLIRFSSVKRALATWTGLAGEGADISKIGKKELEIINKLIDNPKYEDELLKSDDNVEVYLGLWNKSTRDINDSIKAIEKFLKSSKYHIKLLISYYLYVIVNTTYKREIAKKVIKEYGDSKKIVEILACYLNFVINYGSASNLKRNIKNGEIEPKTYFKNKNEAIEFFDILEKALNLMDGKDKLFDPCIFPWFYQSIRTNTIATAMALITVFYPDDSLKNRMMKYLKEIDTWNRNYYLEILFEKPSNKEEKDFVIAMLSDRSDAGISAYEIVKDNNLIKEYPREIEDLLRLKSGDRRKKLIDLLMS